MFSVQAALKNIDGEIIVIDNASDDDSKTFFRGRFPGVQFVYNKENIGFGAANNEAIAFAKGDYILFLNPDTLIPEDSIEQCIAFIKSKNDGVALGVKMLDGSGRFLPESKRAFPDPLTSLYKLFGLSRLFPRSKTFAKYYLGNLDKNETSEIDVLAGAFIMLPRKILNEIKGFDEDFFMYGEDVDLSYRIQQAGFSNYYYPEVAIVHFKGESTKKGSLNYVKVFYNAMSIFVKKHYGASKAGFFNTFLHIGIAFRGMLSLAYQFLKWVSIPVLDVLLIFISFWFIRRMWIVFLLPYLAFDKRILLNAFPLMAVIYLIISFYSGLYDRPYKPKRLYYGFGVSTLIFFTIHALVPSLSRFPRGVFLTSIFLSFILIVLLRELLIRLGIIDNPRRLRMEEIAVVGGEEEYNEVLSLLDEASSHDVILGRIGVTENENNTIGSFGGLDRILKNDLVKRLIYCKGTLSYKEIIDALERMPKNIKAGFFVADSSSIIGSDDKNKAGSYKNGKGAYRLENPSYLRQKRLFDIVMSSLLLIVVPFHFLIKKKSRKYLLNCVDVMIRRKTLVGYAGDGSELPKIRPCVLTTTGFPREKNKLPLGVLNTSDRIYAQNYSIFKDFRLICRGYWQI